MSVVTTVANGGERAKEGGGTTIDSPSSSRNEQMEERMS